MSMAPDPILKATLETLSWAVTTCKNWTYSPGVPVKLINDLMDAIHNLPDFVMNWERHSLAELLTNLSYIDTEGWRERAPQFPAPDLVAVFKDRLSYYGGTGFLQDMSTDSH